MFDHQLQPLQPRVEDIYQNIIGNFIENFNDSTFQLFARSEVVVSQFFFDIPEEEEVTWG
jgi:hypothetical protein